MKQRRPLTDAERAEVQEYKAATAGLEGPFHYDVSDLPDEAVFTLLAFAWWRAGRSLSVTGEQIVAELDAGLVGRFCRWFSRMVERRTG